VTAFIVSLVVTGIMVGIIILVGKRRRPGQPLTWGEAFLAAMFAFALLLMIYGVVPDRWLRWADGELKWRSDAVGIPLGPFGKWLGIGGKDNVFFGDGVTFFGRGRIQVTKQDIRDAVAAGLYIVFGLAQIWIWFWWQKRGKATTRTPELETSAYGRPLVRKT
jgi:hypothetical protein